MNFGVNDFDFSIFSSFCCCDNNVDGDCVGDGSIINGFCEVGVLELLLLLSILLLL